MDWPAGWYWVARWHHVRPSIAVAAAVWLLTDIGMLEFKPLYWLDGWHLWVAKAHLSLREQADDLRAFSDRDAVPDDAYLLLFIPACKPELERHRHHRQIAAGLEARPAVLRLLPLLDGTTLALTIAQCSTPAIAAIAKFGSDRWISGNTLAHRQSSDTGVDLGRLAAPFRQALGHPTIQRAELSPCFPGSCTLDVDRGRRCALSPEAHPTWSTAAAGLVLMNHQVMTGLQFENFHWSYVAGPCLSLLIGLLLANSLSRLTGAFARWCVFLDSGLCLVTGGCLQLDR